MPVQATLPNLEAFVTAAETLNFSTAAQRLRVTPQAVSRAVSRLEGTLGVVLFRRTTRSLALTDAGTAYQQACARALDALRDAEDTLRHSAARVSGTLRLSAPTTFGHAVLPGLLASFREKHPGVQVALGLSNRNVDFTRDDVDLAIRMGTLADQPGLKRQLLGTFPVGVYASPGYLNRRGTPERLADLDQHDTIVFIMPRTQRPLPWTLTDDDGTVHRLVPRHPLSVSDDAGGLLPLAAAGLGLVHVYDMMAAPYVERGALVEVLPRTRGEARAFSAVYPAGRKLPRAAQVFVQHLRQQRAGDARASAVLR